MFYLFLLAHLVADFALRRAQQHGAKLVPLVDAALTMLDATPQDLHAVARRVGARVALRRVRRHRDRAVGDQVPCGASVLHGRLLRYSHIISNTISAGEFLPLA